MNLLIETLKTNFHFDPVLLSELIILSFTLTGNNSRIFIDVSY